jgi:hypothetical protein
LRINPKLLYGYVRTLPKLMKNMVSEWRDKALPAYLEKIEKWMSLRLATASKAELLAGVRALTIADGHYWFKVSIILASAKVTDGLLNCFLASRLVRSKLTSGTFLRGFPSKTMEA